MFGVSPRIGHAVFGTKFKSRAEMRTQVTKCKSDRLFFFGRSAKIVEVLTIISLIERDDKGSREGVESLE